MGVTKFTRSVTTNTSPHRGTETRATGFLQLSFKEFYSEIKDTTMIDVMWAKQAPDI